MLPLINFCRIICQLYYYLQLVARIFFRVYSHGLMTHDHDASKFRLYKISFIIYVFRQIFLRSTLRVLGLQQVENIQ